MTTDHVRRTPSSARPVRLGHRVMARLRARGLDDLLVRGAGPYDHPVLRARASWLVSAHHRAGLAGAWLEVLEQARQNGVVLDSRAPVAREAVLAAEPQIVRLAVLLRGPVLASAATIVRVRTVITDGTGVLYTGRGLSHVVDGLADDLERGA